MARQHVQTFSCTAARPPLDFDAVIAAIGRRYPGTRVVEADWFAARHAADAAVCRRMGWPLETWPPMVSLRRRWAEVGLQRGVEVPLDDGRGVLYGRLDKDGGLFVRRRGTLWRAHVAGLIEILERFFEVDVSFP